MHRPHIPKLAFQSTSGAITRPPAAAVQQPSFGIQGVAATVTSPTRATAAAAAAASSSQHSQLFHSRAAPPAIRSAHTSSSSQQQQQQQHRIPAHHISEEFRALEDEQREDEEQGDQGEEEELNADEDDYEADFQSEPITAALNGAGSRANKQNAAGSSSVYARAEELLDQSDDDLDSRPTTAAATTTVTRRPLRDEAFVAEDGITSERIIPITGRSAAAASRRTSRGSAARSDGSATATSAAHAASGTTATAAVPARSRLDRGSLRNWVSTASQMRQRAELLEKEHSAYLHSRQGWFTPGSEELRAIDELERGAVEAAERVRRERESLQAEMKRIATLVQRFKTHVGSPVDQEAYVTQLRQLMESIEESLAGFKARAKEKYIALNKAEIELEKECDAMLVGFERWSEAPEDPVIAKPQASKSSPEKADAVNGEMKDPFATEADSTNDAESLTTAASIRSALERLDDQIASSGGSTGFWDSRDHAHYLKLLTQRGKAGGGGATASVKDDPEFLARMVAEISGQTPSTALSHILWHATWQSRVAEKKRLIARWKEVKERERDVEGLQEELERQQEWEANERKEIQSFMAAQQAEKAASVAAWKAARQAKEDARQAKAMRAKEEKERLAREQQEAERRRLRSIVEAYQEERAVLSLVSQIQSQPTQADLAEKERAEKEARRRLKEQQAEELRKVKEKREAKLAETARERERKSALERASAAPATQRDPSRLTQPTGAMIARAKQREEEEEAIEKYKREHGGRTPSTMLGRTSLGHTAMPSWRKGL